MTRDNRKQDQQARAAWMYYVAGRTQDDIARALGVSRQTAQRLVAQAMASGMVKVRIDHPLARCRDLADRLRARFGLALAEVTPAEAGPAGVAMALADLIEGELSRPDPQIVAIGTGRTPTTDQIAEVHALMRDRLSDKVADAALVRLLYGGSVKPGNAAEIFAIPHVDGALVGGASLKAADFGPVIAALAAA